MDKCIWCGLENYRPTSKWCSRKCQKKYMRKVFKENNKCVRCGREKENNFTICDKCKNNSDNYYNSNREAINRKSKIKYNTAKSSGICTMCGNGKPYDGRLKCKKCHVLTQEYVKKYKSAPNYISASLLSRAKQRAKEFDLPFNITIDDIVVPQKCPILGINIECGKGKMENSSPSLDRVIPELGYVKGNICVISQEANRLKAYLTKDIIFKILGYIEDHDPKKWQ